MINYKLIIINNNTHVGNCHSDSRDVQQFSHRCDFGQRRRDTGRDQHHHSDNNGGHAGRHSGAGFHKDFLTVQQYHVDAAQLLTGDQRTRNDYRLDVTLVGEQF